MDALQVFLSRVSAIHTNIAVRVRQEDGARDADQGASCDFTIHNGMIA